MSAGFFARSGRFEVWVLSKPSVSPGDSGASGWHLEAEGAHASDEVAIDSKLGSEVLLIEQSWVGWHWL